MTPRYIARSASDRMDDWPFWFVADTQRGGLDVTAELVRQHVNQDYKGATLFSKHDAIAIARFVNQRAAE